jgi:hypothetical protein
MARTTQLGWEQGDKLVQLDGTSGEVQRTFTRGTWSKWANRSAGAGYGGIDLLRADLAEFYIGFGVYSSLVDQFAINLRGSDNVTHLSIDGGGGTGYIRALRGTSTVLGTSSPNAIATAVWNYIEVHFVIHDSAGVVQVKLNGQLVLDLSGQDTRNAGVAASVDRIVWGHNSLSNVVYFDDFVCNSTTGAVNNSWPGDTKIVGLWPNAAGDTTMLNRPSTSDLATEILADTPWMYLKLDETSGTNADDSSPNNRDGTYVGTPTLGADSGLEGIRAGDNEVNFDGSDDEITLPAQTFALASATSPLTVLLWFKTASENVCLIGADDVADADPHFRVRVRDAIGGTTGKLEVAWRATDGSGNQSMDFAQNFEYRLTDNRWHMLAITFDSAKVVTVYIDGWNTDQLTHTMASGMTLDRCILGRDPEATSGYNRFVGKMSEFAVFQSTLTHARIKLLYALTWRNYEMLDDSASRHGLTFYDALGSLFGYDDFYQPSHEDDIAFLQETTVDDLDLYNMDDVPGDFDTVQAVQVWARARKSDAGTGLFAFLLKSGGSTDTGADNGLAAGSWLQFTKVYDRNPIGPADWTTSSVNAAQAGLKVR